MIILHFKVDFYRKKQGECIQHDLKKAFLPHVYILFPSVW